MTSSGNPPPVGPSRELADHDVLEMHDRPVHRGRDPDLNRASDTGVQELDPCPRLRLDASPTERAVCTRDRVAHHGTVDVSDGARARRDHANLDVVLVEHALEIDPRAVLNDDAPAEPARRQLARVADDDVQSLDERIGTVREQPDVGRALDDHARDASVRAPLHVEPAAEHPVGDLRANLPNRDVLEHELASRREHHDAAFLVVFDNRAVELE